jgi:predicted component of type VI protein secretion system
MPIEFQVSLPSGVIATQCFAQSTVVVGTGSDCDLVLSIQSENVFRFCVELGESGATVICLHDVGMMLNRSAVFKKGEIRSLRHGDIIRLVGSDCRLTFSYTAKETLVAAKATTTVDDDSVSYRSASDWISYCRVEGNKGTASTNRCRMCRSAEPGGADLHIWQWCGS